MENRLKLFYDAGSYLFINKGFARTQIKDIAKEIGLSTGMLYQYFTSKRDILDFILKCTVDPSVMEQDYEYPITSQLFDGLDDEIKTAFGANQEQLGKHLADHAAGYPLAEMFSDAYDMISKYGVGCLIIEHNTDDLKELADYYRGYRYGYFEQVKRYIEIYIEKGEFRKVDDVFYTTRAVVEIMTWWGMHIRNDAFEIDKTITKEKAKAICMDVLLNAYSR